jgi:hypothetical protein
MQTSDIVKELDQIIASKQPADSEQLVTLMLELANQLLQTQHKVAELAAGQSGRSPLLMDPSDLIRR